MVYTETNKSQPHQVKKNPMSVLLDLHNNNNNNTPTLDIESENEYSSDKHIAQTKTGNKSVKKLAKIDVSKAKSLELESPPKDKDRNKAERNKLDEYYYQHREQKLEYQKNYNRQKGDVIKDYNKSYYMKRREEILEKARTKVTCECGCVVQLFNMNSHKKTKKHVRYLEMRQAMMNATAGSDAGARALPINTKL
jgi:hypothetical protein